MREDALYVAAPVIPKDEGATRRRVASAIARLYDVLGFFSPYVLLARTILQATWDLTQGWDGLLPEELQVQWRAWLSGLHSIGSHPIP